MRKFHARAVRSGGWWSLITDVPDAIVHTQSRRIDQMDYMLRDAIATALDVRPDSFDVEITMELPPDIAAEVEAANGAARIAEEAAAAAAAARQAVAVHLQRQGYSVRDVGALLDVSSQRVSQLVAEQKKSGSAVEEQLASVLVRMEAIKVQIPPVIKAAKAYRKSA